MDLGHRIPVPWVLLEKKSDMKRRGLASPDDGDALALTFAQPAAIDMPEETPRAGQVQREYNPYEAANIGHDPYATVR